MNNLCVTYTNLLQCCDNMDTKIISQLGLTNEQANVYAFLLEQGMCPVKVISAKTGIGRALTYKILDQLIALNLAEKRENAGSITMFFPSHPQKLKEMLQLKQSELQQYAKNFEDIYGRLSSNYNMLLGKPNVQYHEGMAGLQQIYDDILDTNQDIQIISSPIDEREEALDLIREQNNKQKERNIRTRAITPIGIQNTYATPLGQDGHFLITRKSIPAERLKIPAQIIIYSDKVAITNFKESILTVLIESKYIAETFKIMFEYIWGNSTDANK